MKKLLLTAAALVMLSTASLADQNTENQLKMDEMRHQLMVMTDQMITGQMEMLKIYETILSSYQKLLKQMMEFESNQNR